MELRFDRACVQRCRRLAAAAADPIEDFIAAHSTVSVERAVLLVAAFELKNHVDIPYRVVINEAVELAKTFGGADGYKYVNGVLDKLSVQLRAAETQAARKH